MPDRLVFKYGKTTLLTNLRIQFVIAHLFFCWRKGVFQSKCKICTQVVRWEIDNKVKFEFTIYRLSGIFNFNNHIFCSKKFCDFDLNKKFECCYFESINKPNEIPEMFAVIVVRILLNFVKRYLFKSEEKSSLVFYSYLATIASKCLIMFAIILT